MIEFSNSILKDCIKILNNSTHKLVFRTFLEPGGGQNELHYHTKLNEKFKVIQGALTIIIKDDKRVLKTNEEALIRKKTNHMFYNNSNDLQLIYGLANDEMVNKKALPKNIIHTAISLYMMDAYSPKLPYLIQKISILTMALFGKLIGIEKMLIEKYCS